jgi:hypothetical protein
LEEIMSIGSARVQFEKVRESTSDSDMAELAEGLRLLAQGLDSELSGLERKLGDIKSEVDRVKRSVR